MLFGWEGKLKKVKEESNDSLRPAFMTKSPASMQLLYLLIQMAGLFLMREGRRNVKSVCTETPDP